jgi:hypothetical protein
MMKLGLTALGLGTGLLLAMSGCSSEDTLGKKGDSSQIGTGGQAGGGSAGAASLACEGPNPAGCRATGCPDGQKCDTTVGCSPSGCSCDADNGIWICTTDCSGGTCVDDPGTVQCSAGCASTGCPAGQKCDTSSECIPSYCWCTPDGLVAGCTDDCGGGVCVDDPGGAPCRSPNPAGCSETGCPAGQKCDTNSGCAPSACACEASTGTWTCTADCNGGICVPEDPGTPCRAPNPAGCLSEGCPAGQKCDVTQGCHPSACSCNAESGNWDCTADCSGGACVPE